jgi:hypothetical protein
LLRLCDALLGLQRRDGRAVALHLKSQLVS